MVPVLATATANHAGQAVEDPSMLRHDDRAFSLKDMSPEEFMNLTPKKIKAATGKKLKLKEVIMLKAAQKAMKKKAKSSDGAAAADLDKTGYIILAILIPFLAVGLASDWEGNDWWITLLLMFLFYIPGIIYAFIKMGDYYP